MIWTVPEPCPDTSLQQTDAFGDVPALHQLARWESALSFFFYLQVLGMKIFQAVCMCFQVLSVCDLCLQGVDVG